MDRVESKRLERYAEARSCHLTSNQRSGQDSMNSGMVRDGLFDFNKCTEIDFSLLFSYS